MPSMSDETAAVPTPDENATPASTPEVDTAATGTEDTTGVETPPESDPTAPVADPDPSDTDGHDHDPNSETAETTDPAGVEANSDNTSPIVGTQADGSPLQPNDPRLDEGDQPDKSNGDPEAIKDDQAAIVADIAATKENGGTEDDLQPLYDALVKQQDDAHAAKIEADKAQIQADEDQLAVDEAE